MRTAVALAKSDYETLKYTFEECRSRMSYIKEEDYRTLEAIVNRIKERLNKANFFEKFQISSLQDGKNGVQ